MPGRLDDEETVARAATRYTYCMLRFCSPLPDVTCCKYNRFPTRTQLWQGKSRRRKDGTDVSTTARGVVERLYCFPDVFHPMIDRLAEFVVPYRQALETEVAQRNMHLYLKGLLSHLPRKNAEDIATFVDVQRQVIQEFIGIAPWDHRPLIEVLVPQVARRLGQPDGIIAFDPSSFPKRGTHSVGVKRQ